MTYWLRYALHNTPAAQLEYARLRYENKQLKDQRAVGSSLGLSGAVTNQTSACAPRSNFGLTFLAMLCQSLNDI